jgi:hypothetical protein
MTSREAPLALLFLVTAAMALGASSDQNTPATSCAKGRPLPPTATAPGSTWSSDEAPPERFQGDATVTVRFVAPERVQAECIRAGRPAPGCGQRIVACSSSRGRWLIVANPCARPDEAQARDECHELGHINGWPPTHGR